MKRWTAGLALVFALAAGVVCAQPRTMSPDEVETLPDAEVVARIMGQIGAEVVHVDRRKPRLTFIFPDEPVRRRIKFMLRPQAATGMGGLCVAPFWDVLFEEKGKGLVFQQLTVETSYRVVGEVGLRIGEESSVDLVTEARCAEIQAPDELLEARDQNTAWQAASLAQVIRREFAGMPAGQVNCLLEEGCEAMMRNLTARAVAWATPCSEGNGRTWAPDEICTAFSVRGTRQPGSRDVYVTVVAKPEYDPLRWRLRKLEIVRPAQLVE